MTHDRDESLKRVNAYSAIGQWHEGLCPETASRLLTELLGFETYDDLCLAQRRDQEINRVLLLLAGEHGYTVYKILLARKEVS